jgi:excisionase family DNA binding protein
MIVMTADELLTLEEAGKRLKVSKYTIKKYIDAGKLEGVRVGIQWRVRTSAIDRYIERNVKPESSR